MRIAYDPSVDALCIIFTETTVTTEHVAEGIAIDYDANGLVAGIEILDAIERFGDVSTLGHVTFQGVGTMMARAA
jgi:uncharacterized protein YuzE